MPMICPKCQGAYENNLQCPKCSVMLVYQATSLDHERSLAEQMKWHQSPAGRMFAGVLIALGLSYGLLRLVSTVIPQGGLAPTTGLVVFYVMQIISVTAGGVLAGVGRRMGYGYGLGVGLVSGIVFMMGIVTGLLAGVVAPFASELLPANAATREATASHTAYYVLPILHAACGALGGMIGSIIWKPPPELNMPTLVATRAEKKKEDTGLVTQIALPKTDDKNKGPLSGPVAWVRVLVGIGVAVFGGSFGTEPVRQFIIRVSEGGLVIQTHVQDQVTLGEIFALSIFLGGIIGGTSQRNGLKQGLVVGLGSGIGMVPFLMSGELAEYAFFVVLSALFIAPLGGWFGSNLLPPPPPPKYTRGAVD
ncbi:MAG: hypothetical protein AB7K24_14395 [Gemmataceae bacterium]